MYSRSSVAVILLVLLAGCSGATPQSGAATDEPIVITDPRNLTADGSAHIHDYWKGQARLTILESTHPGGEAPGTGPGYASGGDIAVRSFQPEADHVVPQGTSAVEITFTWTDAALDSYATPALWLKTAAQSAANASGPMAKGVPVTVNITAEDADLPHQVLSAWRFELRMSSPDPMPLRFKGAVTIQVDAIRGLPLPTFPGHPDFWNGATELPLLRDQGTLSYFEDLRDGGCNGFVCPKVMVPEPGFLVPYDASFVHVMMNWTSTGVPLQLAYHGGDARQFMVANPISTQGGRSLYLLEVGGGADGPYALQSQWEFKVQPATTGAVRTAWNAQYSIDVVAQK